MMRDLHEIAGMFGELDGYERYRQACAAWAVRKELRSELRNEQVQEQRRRDPNWRERNAAYVRSYRERQRADPDARESLRAQQREHSRRYRERRLTERLTDAPKPAPEGGTEP